ncbi:MAG: FtsX-like permease family protein [Acidobacteria bacterium]|nr:FtsX-like permease family protein [Acidobacteriota bacterium]
MPERRWSKWLTRARGEGRPGDDADLSDEVAFHLEMETKKYIEQGQSPREAERLARVNFGAMQRHVEECRDERQGNQIDMLMLDVRYALRSLGRNWGFATAAILTLALGIGANTAIFSMIYGVLMRPLPYANGSRLVLLEQNAPGIGVENAPASIPQLYDYREQSSGFDELVEYHTMFFILLGRDEPERVQTGVVSDNFFDTLGVTPLHGRTFVDGEDDLDSDPVLVLTYDYWQRAFGGDPDVVGQVFEMNTKPHTVVGVLPQIPQFPNPVDVYMPTSACPFRANSERNMAGNHQAFANLFVFGQLADDATIASASSEVDRVIKGFESDFPDNYPSGGEYNARVVDLKDQLTSNARPMLMMLVATAGLVLLIACANVANLSLARVMRRESEIAVRAALGASRGRLIRQLLTESTVLALLGGIFGLAFAYVGLDILIDFAARYTPRAPQVSIDGWVLLFTLGVSVTTGLVFGTFPALPGTRDLGRSMKEGGRTTASGGIQLRRGLVVLQVALSVVLLVGAGLTLRSLSALQAVDPGFNTEQVLTARVSLDFAAFNDMNEMHDFLQELNRRIGEIPIARAAALTQKPPYRSVNPNLSAILIEGKDAEDSLGRPQVDFNAITTDYFETLDIPLLAGRTFNSGDAQGTAAVAVINETLAREYWPGQDPVDTRISFDDGENWVTVVGVVGDTRLYGPEVAVVPELYRPFGQAGMPTWLVVRTVGDPLAATRAVKDTAYSMGSNPISDVQALATLRDDAVASPRLTASLLGVFALLALAVTLTGIAGVMAFAVSQRTREMGLRLALGAQPGKLLNMVVRQGMVQVAVGLVLGVGGALAFGQVLADMLFSVDSGDPTTFVVVVVTLAIASLIAVLIPARRAIAVDPATALRSD